MSERAELGFLGLGRMGTGIVRRMLKSKKIDVIVWNRSYDKVKDLIDEGARGTKTIKDTIKNIKQKRKVVWMMLPAGEVTEQTFNELIKLLKKGDIIIDGANSNFHDTIRRADIAKKKGIGLLDVGVSGGVIAAERGYPLMIGGSEENYNFCRPIFESFAKPDGFGLVGAAGAGHYVKMVHNAVEYGMMQSIAEGFELLDRGRYKNIDKRKVARIWNNGTIISSFLMEMTQRALDKGDSLESIAPYVEDSGEGKWAAIEAMEFSVPFVANSYALHARYISRNINSYSFKLLSAMRNEFGGHEMKKK